MKAINTKPTMKAKLILLVLTWNLTSGAFSQEEPTTVESRIGKLEFTHDFANGYPTKQTVEKLYNERDFQRACQLYLWSLPAVSFNSWQQGQASLGIANGEVGAFLTYDDKLGILTANATTPYYFAFADLTAGPLIVDLPPNVRGGIIDAWQTALPDSSKAAKYLVLGPGQKQPDDVAGFEVRRSSTFNIFMGLRITVTDPKEAQELLSQFRIYPYAERVNPPRGKIVPANLEVEREAAARTGLLGPAQRGDPARASSGA